MKTSQFSSMTLEELKAQLLQKTTEMFKIRMRCSAGVEQKTHLLKKFRRDIARVKTIMNQKVRHEQQ